MKKIVFITAPEIFRDEEYFEPKKVLEDAGMKVITASTKVGKLLGKLGAQTNSDMVIDDIKSSDFDAIAFIGGGGASVFFENKVALTLANEFFKANKPTASICIAGITLANAGVLKGKKATVYIDGKDALLKGGADFTGKSLEVDGNVITANGPAAAKSFGEAILKALS